MAMENCKTETSIHHVQKIVITPEKLARLNSTKEVYSTRNLLIYKSDGSVIGFNLFSDGINPIELKEK